jgi:hypothetical protein
MASVTDFRHAGFSKLELMAYSMYSMHVSKIEKEHEFQLSFGTGIQLLSMRYEIHLCSLHSARKTWNTIYH